MITAFPEFRPLTFPEKQLTFRRGQDLNWWLSERLLQSNTTVLPYAMMWCQLSIFDMQHSNIEHILLWCHLLSSYWILKHVTRQFHFLWMIWYLIDAFYCVVNITEDIWNKCSFYTPHNEVRGLYWIYPVCLSVCPSVCLLTFRVRPVASTVQDGFFPYLV